MLDQSTIVAYAMDQYANPKCRGLDEFQSDMTIPSLVSRMLAKQGKRGPAQYRQVANHIITLFNVFPPIAACRVLGHGVDSKFHPQLKSYLVWLGYWDYAADIPEIAMGIQADRETSEALAGMPR